MAQIQPVPITPPPGVVKTESDRIVEGRWTASDGVRWVRGLPQKNGGNVRAVATPTSGQPRIAHAWRDNQADNFIAVGTYRKLYVYDSAFAQNDITPFRLTGTLGTNPFTPTNGSPNISVLHTAHGLNSGDTIIFSGATTTGGLNLNGTWIVLTVTDANNYVFVAGGNANSNTAGGGAAVAFSYEIPIGVENPAFGLGYGVGGYGIGTYGTARSSSTIAIEPRVWSLDHFGKFLVASFNGGSVYQFDPTQNQPWPRALKVDTSAPTDCRALFVTPERYVFALRENMTVGWCTQGDFTIWTPGSSNTANTRTLTEGTKLIGGRVLGPYVSLVWTDAALYVFQYSGNQFVYQSTLAGKDCGLIGPNAAITVAGVAYWEGMDNFYMYNGSVQKMPNSEDIRKYVYDAIDLAYGYTCTATYIPKYNEIRFCYTIVGQQNPTLTVVYSIDQQRWWPLNEGRHAGTHFTQGDTRPYIPATDGYLYQHENGYDNNGVAITATMTMAPYALSEGRQNMQVEGIQFDFFQLTGSISVELDAWDRLQDPTPMDTETDVITAATGLTDTRISGRYLGMTFTGSGLGQYWRLGKPVAFVMPIGDRR